MKIVAVSDTHEKEQFLKIPECDLFIHAGDWTFRGEKYAVEKFGKWLNQIPAQHIVVIPGNHELYFENALPQSKDWLIDVCPKVNLLIEESIEINGVNIYGSPITPFFYAWAWNRYRYEIKPHWDNIPENTDILITHGGPYSILDQTIYGQSVGCEYLYDRIKHIKPDLHIFGHIHAAKGEKHFDGTSYYNVSSCDEQYILSQGYTVIDYEKN